MTSFLDSTTGVTVEVPEDLTEMYLAHGYTEIKSAAPTGGETGSPDLIKLKKSELLALAEERGLSGLENPTKAEIVAALEAAVDDGAGESDEDDDGGSGEDDGNDDVDDGEDGEDGADGVTADSPSPAGPPGSGGSAAGALAPLATSRAW
jgi:hypothetical protein